VDGDRAALLAFIYAFYTLHVNSFSPTVVDGSTRNRQLQSGVFDISVHKRCLLHKCDALKIHTVTTACVNNYNSLSQYKKKHFNSEKLPVVFFVQTFFSSKSEQICYVSAVYVYSPIVKAVAYTPGPIDITPALNQQLICACCGQTRKRFITTHALFLTAGKML